MTTNSLPKIVLDLEGDHIPAAKFISAAQSFFGLLDDVATEVAGKSRSVQWSVSLEKGSVVIGVEPFGYAPGTPVRRIMSAVTSGLRLLEKKPSRPQSFNDSALNHASNLAQIADGRTITKAAVQLRQQEKSPEAVSFQKTSTHVEQILGPQICDYGTIEGFLETISVRGSAHFSLYDSLTNQAIRCYIEDSKLDQAWKILRARRRVAVSGFIAYRKSGIATRIDVDELIPLSESNIGAEEVYGILTRA